MRVLIFGATGMIGQAVLRECLLAGDVEAVCTLGRTASGRQHAKLRELVRADLWHYAALEEQLRGFDACFFCLGVSSAGLTPTDYERVTFGLTMAAAEVLCRLNSDLVFAYVSGNGTDGSEGGRRMWARVKGRTENALLRLPFGAAYMFRPGIVQPVHGERSKTSFYRLFYKLAGPFLPLARRLFPRHVLTTEQLGRAILAAARRRPSPSILETADIVALSK